MDRKVYSKNIFESGFESFEFDEVLLKNIDSALDGNKVKVKQEISSVKNNAKLESSKNEKNKETKYCEFSLLIEDSDESQLMNSSENFKNHHSSKVETDSKNKITPLKGFISCLSPILCSKGKKKLNLSSSTPLKPTDGLNSKEKPKQPDEIIFSDWNYSEADLFDDWGDVDDDKSKKNTSQITFSQAMKIIEEAEKRQDNNETETESVDLLTGEVVRNVENELNLDNKNSSDNSVVVVNECKVESKPVAAQRLNFELEKPIHKQENIFFSSDDEFDFLIQDILDKPKTTNLNAKANESFEIKEMQNESLEVVGIRRKKGKCYQVIESDSEEDSPNSCSKFFRKNRIKRQKTSKEKSGKEFIESEAEVSDGDEISSDEAEVDGEYDKSFLDEDSYYSQNNSAKMTAKYLESVKTYIQAGSFKIPAPKPFNPDTVFSQIPDPNSDYEIDSFCVNEVEDMDAQSELSELEVAEQFLEMNKKRRKEQSKRCKKM